ncbi:hypothetical protein P7C70_g7739, partial [Phenoliferia sp. Uapishka_3]
MLSANRLKYGAQDNCSATGQITQALPAPPPSSPYQGKMLNHLALIVDSTVDPLARKQKPVSISVSTLQLEEKAQSAAPASYFLLPFSTPLHLLSILPKQGRTSSLPPTQSPPPVTSEPKQVLQQALLATAVPHRYLKRRWLRLENQATEERVTLQRLRRQKQQCCELKRGGALGREGIPKGTSTSIVRIFLEWRLVVWNAQSQVVFSGKCKLAMPELYSSVSNCDPRC